MHVVAESPGDHDITKVTMGPEHVDTAGMAYPKGTALKDNRLTLGDQSICSNASSFPCWAKGCGMQIHTEGQQKAAFYRCVNPGCQSNYFHSPCQTHLPNYHISRLRQ